MKTDEEIEIMKEGGERLRRVVTELRSLIRPGVTTKEIDDAAGSLIREYQGEASFKKVPHYHWSTCLPINEQVVHTPPSERIVKEGDLLTLDIGMYYKGYHTDYADTFAVGGVSSGIVRRFLEAGKIALNRAIGRVRTGNRLGHISEEIQKTIVGNGFCILKELGGHGIGKELHEDPFVFGYAERPVERTIRIEPGLVIAVEVIYALTTEEIRYEGSDEWSVITADRSISACLEHTVAVKEEKTLILT